MTPRYTFLAPGAKRPGAEEVHHALRLDVQACDRSDLHRHVGGRRSTPADCRSRGRRNRRGLSSGSSALQKSIQAIPESSSALWLLMRSAGVCSKHGLKRSLVSVYSLAREQQVRSRGAKKQGIDCSERRRKRVDGIGASIVFVMWHRHR